MAQVVKPQPVQPGLAADARPMVGTIVVGLSGGRDGNSRAQSSP